ncbi:hypothetical protein NMY22_g12867 [Coprinellus aureogranulatus]|nr:hypothetical protein NMY22_g12867 [Coprinellus aureogranulatus]
MRDLSEWTTSCGLQYEEIGLLTDVEIIWKAGPEDHWCNLECFPEPPVIRQEQACQASTSSQSQAKKSPISKTATATVPHSKSSKLSQDAVPDVQELSCEAQLQEIRNRRNPQRRAKRNSRWKCPGASGCNLTFGRKSDALRHYYSVHVAVTGAHTAEQDGEKRGEPIFRILFVNGHLSRPLVVADFNDVRAALTQETADFLNEELGVSPLFLATVLRKGWELKFGNCHWAKSMPEQSQDGTTIEGWYRYSCGLKSFPSYVWYSYNSKCTTYIVTNCEYNGIQDAIVRCVEEGMGRALLRPLAVDGFVAEAVSEGWGEAMLLPRKILIKYVRQTLYTSPRRAGLQTRALQEHLDDQQMAADTRESVKELHVLSYNLLIIKEDMTDHIARLEYLIDVQQDA